MFVLNRTIQILEDGNVDIAKRQLSGLINITDRFIAFIDRAVAISKNNTGPDSNFTRALEELENTLVSVKSDMEQALAALDDNDILSATSYLESAVDTLKNTISSVIPIFKGIHRYLMHMETVFKNMRDRFREALISMFIHRMSFVIENVEKIDLRLKYAYSQYKQGQLSSEELLSLLNSGETVLKSIRNHLNELPRPPTLLIQRINNILDWISQIKSEVSG
jgi:exonuclease VII small subunit